MQREKIQKGGKSKGQGLRKVKRDSKNEKRREKSGGREGGKIGCECKRRCFERGRRPPLGLCLRGVGGGGASCGVCFSSRITRYVIVRVAKVVQDRGW